ncbi:MAG: hypothetical protein Q9161_009112 [Pseudevernia consocians]
MATIPTSALELAEGKPNHMIEKVHSDQTNAQKEAQIIKSSPEHVHDKLKSSAPTTSDEDASGSIPAEQTAKDATIEKLDSTLPTMKEVEGCGSVEGSDDNENPTAGSTEAKVDQEPTEKIKQEEGEKIARSEEIGDENTRDEDDKISSKEKIRGDESQDEDGIDYEISEGNDIAYSEEAQEFCKRRAPNRIKQFTQYFRIVDYRMEHLERELEKLRGDDSKHKPKDATEEMISKPPEPPKVIQGIRRLNWSDYRLSSNPQEATRLDNPGVSQKFSWEGLKVRPDMHQKGRADLTKPSGDQQYTNGSPVSTQQHHVLEVLIEDPGINKRRRVRRHDSGEFIIKLSNRDAKKYQERDPINVQNSKTTLQSPERVRLCSKPLLVILSAIVDPAGPPLWDNIPHIVILRPFKLFVIYETEIRDALKDLEKKWQSNNQISPSEKASERKPKEQHGEANNSNDEEDKRYETTVPNPLVDTVVKTDTFEALAHLRLLVEFFENDMKSTFALRKQINAKENCPIAFADLWHLFEHGQEVRTPDVNVQVFKVAKFTGGRDLLSDNIEPSGPNVRTDTDGGFFIECYHYDFNGTKYGPVHRLFEIRRYEGVRDITSLQVYPLSFDPEHKKGRTHLAQRGEKFMALARVNRTAHKTYRGLSLDKHAEEIESPIIVDFQLAIAKAGVEIPSIIYESKIDYDRRETYEKYSRCGFEGCNSADIIFQDYSFDSLLSETFLTKQKVHLAPVEDPEELGEDERILLPCSVHGFVLRSRKWRTFNIDDVDDIKYSSGFDDLVLPSGHKETLEALVKNHSREGSATGKKRDNKVSMDLVTGKGKGLIILLHGAPGVGKTSTAECIAEKTERPLPQMGLDEADVFLTLRNQTDLSRNAIVSVFLRTLEYYSGILFLTTNRVGALDPAFKSRIHLSLYYPKLTREVSTKIWKSHIRKAKDYFENRGESYTLHKREIIDFSKQHFKGLRKEKAEPWNGRQIRNAFQTAIALAEHEAYMSGGKPKLTDRQFHTVAHASSEFEKYLRITHGRSESQLAEAAKIRTDDLDKAERKMAAITQRQRLRGLPKSEDEPSDSDSEESSSSDTDDTSSSEESPPPRANKKTKKKKKRKSQKVLSEDEAPVTKKSKKEKAKLESESEDEAPARRKSKKGKAKQESTSEDEATPTKRIKKEKKGKKGKKDPSSDEERDSSDMDKKMEKAAQEVQGKEKAKTTSKSFK